MKIENTNDSCQSYRLLEKLMNGDSHHQNLITSVYQFQLNARGWNGDDIDYILCELTSTKDFRSFEELRTSDYDHLHLYLRINLTNHTCWIDHFCDQNSFKAAVIWYVNDTIYAGVELSSDQPVILEIVPADQRVISFHAANAHLYTFIREFRNKANAEMQMEIKRSRGYIVENICNGRTVNYDA